MADDVLQVELEILDDKAQAQLQSFFGGLDKTAKLPDLGVKELNKGFDDLSARAEKTQASFKQIAATRLDAGLANNLTKEMVKASERSNQLNLDIQSIRKELANPARKSSIGFLTDELAAAEREATQLERKLGAVRAEAAKPVGAGLFSADAKTRGFQKQQLSFQANDVITGLLSGQNPTQIAAQQGGQIAQIFDPKQVAATAAAYAGLFSIVAAGAVAIGAAYKVTGDIRAEAERRLKLEEAITAAINKQRLAQIKAVKDLAQARAEAGEDRTFQQRLGSADPESLKRQRATLEQLFDLSPAGAGADKLKEQILALDARLAAIPVERNAKMAEQWEQQIREREQREKEAAAERSKSIAESFTNQLQSPQLNAAQINKSLATLRAGVDGLVADEANNLITQYSRALDAMSEKAQGVRNNLQSTLAASTNNPLVQMMLDFENATKAANREFGLLGGNIAQTVAALSQAQIGNQIYDLRLGSRLEAFDLSEDAKRFRNPAPKVDPAANQKRIDEVVAASIKAGGALQGVGGTLGSYLAAQAGGAENLTAEQKRSIYEARMIQAGLAGGMSEQSIISTLARERSGEDPNRSANERLRQQLEIIRGTDPQNAEQRSLANRKIIALTQGMDPNTLDASLRDAAAAARESEAQRANTAETRAAEQSKEILDIMKEVDKQMKAKGLKVSLGETPVVDIEIRDASLSATQRALGTRATGASTNSRQE